MNAKGSFVTPENIFGKYFPDVLNLITDHSPFPRAQSGSFTKSAKLKAARIHIEETVFFAQVAYQDLNPAKTVEVCAGFGIPSITMSKLFGVKGVCVDSDSGKMAIGSTICKKLSIELTWEQMDLFVYLRKNTKNLNGATLLTTAAYCRDKKKGRPMGSGERDIVNFAKNNQMHLALLPFRTGDIIKRGVSSEKKRVEEYENLLKKSGYIVKKHSTEVLFRGQNAPDWFFLDVLTAKCSY